MGPGARLLLRAPHVQLCIVADVAFSAAGASLHVCMTPHGPDTASYEAAVSVDTQVPQRLPSGTMAFMFEVSQTPRVMLTALQSPQREEGYQQCWAGLTKPCASKRPASSDLPTDNGKLQKRELKAEAAISTG